MWGDRDPTILTDDESTFEKSLHRGARCHKKRPVSCIRPRFYLLIEAIYR